MKWHDIALAMACFLCAGHLVGTFVAALVRFMRWQRRIERGGQWMR